MNNEGVDLNEGVGIKESGQTLTSGHFTLLVLLVIFFLGGESIRAFNFAMILGVVIGTFCSLFVASPIAYLLVGKKNKGLDAAAK